MCGATIAASPHLPSARAMAAFSSCIRSMKDERCRSASSTPVFERGYTSIQIAGILYEHRVALLYYSIAPPNSCRMPSTSISLTRSMMTKWPMISVQGAGGGRPNKKKMKNKNKNHNNNTITITTTQ